MLLTTLVGFYLGSRGPVSWVLMFNTLFGTALLASGASALNQLLEREHDAKMRRTQDRPLPSGRLTPEAVLIIGGVCAACGHDLSGAGGQSADRRCWARHARQLSFLFTRRSSA